MISYGGVPLTAPDRATIARIEQALDWDRLIDFERAVWPGPTTLHWAVAAAFRDRPRKLQSLFWPCGASRWARGYFLATANDLAQIRPLAMNPSTFNALPLVLADGTRTLTTNLYMLPPRPAWQITGQGQLYLLTLVDARFLWWEKSADITTVDEDDEALTWAEVYAQIGTALGGTIAVTPDIAAAYLSPSTSLAAHNEALPLLLDTLARNTGRQIVRKLDGTVLAQDYAAAAVSQQAELNQTDRRKLAGGVFDFGPNGWTNALVPASVTVAFPRFEDDVPAGAKHVVETTLTSLALSEYGSWRGRPNCTQRFGDDVPALFADEDDTTPSNEAELSALAQQIARDWYRWRLGTLATEYAGTPAWTPGGLHDYLLWTHEPGRLSCRVERGPWDDAGDSLSHLGAAGTAGSNPDCPIMVGETDGDPLFPAGTILFDAEQFDVEEQDPCVAKIRTKYPGGVITVCVDDITQVANPIPGYFYFNLCGGSGGSGPGGSISSGGMLYYSMGGSLWYDLCACAVIGGVSGSGSGSGGGGGGGFGISECCSGASIPDTLYVTLSNRTGDCTCWPASFPITRSGDLWSNPDIGGSCESPHWFALSCGGTSCNDWQIASTPVFTTVQGDIPNPEPGCSCDPLYLVFHNVQMDFVCNGSATFIITE